MLLDRDAFVDPTKRLPIELPVPLRKGNMAGGRIPRRALVSISRLLCESNGPP